MACVCAFMPNLMPVLTHFWNQFSCALAEDRQDKSAIIQLAVKARSC